jgi:hypothetical protein
MIGFKVLGVVFGGVNNYWYFALQGGSLVTENIQDGNAWVI